MINNLPLHEYIAMKNKIEELEAKANAKFSANACIINDLANMVHTLLEKTSEAGTLCVVDELLLTYGYKVTKGNITYEINRSSPEQMEIIVR